MIHNRYLSVAVQEFLSQSIPSARPFLLTFLILKIDMLLVVVSCKYIVKTQGRILEILIKALSRGREGEEGEEG